MLALWKKDNDTYNRSEYVALSNSLQLYFDKLKNKDEVFPCFDTFYEFLKDEFVEVLKSENVKDKDFDVSNFLYVLRPYYKNGEFDYLLNAKENLNLLQQRFIVFELDNIKDHPILFPVVTIIIMEVFISKMRKLKGIRKMILIEEAWKAIAKEGMAEYIKYLFKTVRKFWLDTPFASFISNINVLRNQYEVSQRFYFFDGEEQITIDEVYRFLSHRWREKQLNVKKKETENNEQSDNGRSPVSTQKVNKLLTKKRSKVKQHKV